MPTSAPTIGFFAASATLRWKLMSWTRNRCGLSRLAKRPGDLLGQRREVLRGGALGREARRFHLEDAARLVHLVAGEAVERGEEAQRLRAERRRAVGNVGAGPVPRLDDAHRGQRMETGADRRPAHADLEREVAFGRQAIAGAQAAAIDQVADESDHLFGAALDAPAFRVSLRCPSAPWS